MNLTKCSVTMDLTCENTNRDRPPRPTSSTAAAPAPAPSESAANYAPSVLEPLNPKLKGSDPFEAACGDVSE